MRLSSLFTRIGHELGFIPTRLRGLYWRGVLKHLGSRTRFYGSVSITRPDLVSIGAQCTLNRGVLINGRAPVTIGNYVRIAARAMIHTDTLDPLAPRESRGHISKPVVIEDGAWIGAGAIILPGVTIGKDATVGAGSVVLQDVPSDALVFGVPARIFHQS